MCVCVCVCVCVHCHMSSTSTVQNAHLALYRFLTLVPSVFGESFFDKAFLYDPVSILQPFTIFRWVLYTLVRAGFPLIVKRLLE